MTLSCPVKELVSMLPNSYDPPVSLFSWAVNTGCDRLDTTLSKKVFCCVGFTVLSLEKARPTKPLEALSVMNDCETLLGRPIAISVTVEPPMSRVSMPTGPEAVDPSPYDISKLSPSSSLNVDDFEGSKFVCPCCDDAGKPVLNTHLEIR